MNPLFWQAERLAWKVRQKAMREHWRGEREVARAQWRARHPRTFFGFVWGLMWAAFWVGLVMYWVFGGPQAHQNLYQLFHAAMDGIKNLVQDIAAAFGAMQ